MQTLIEEKRWAFPFVWLELWSTAFSTGLPDCTHAGACTVVVQKTHTQILIVSRINISIVITSENGDGPIMLCIITAEKQCMSIKRHYGAFTDSNPITTSLFLTANRRIRDGEARSFAKNTSDALSSWSVPFGCVGISWSQRVERLSEVLTAFWIIHGCRSAATRETGTPIWRRHSSLVAIKEKVWRCFLLVQSGIARSAEGR